MIFKFGDNHIVVSTNGRRKILNFRFADSVALCGIFKEIFVEKTYFKDFGKSRVFSINKTDTVIDIGANVGFFSNLAANLAYQGKVYAFEPVRKNYEQLMLHKIANGLDNIIPQKLAVSDSNKDAKIYLYSKNCGVHSLYREEIRSAHNEMLGSAKTCAAYR